MKISLEEAQQDYYPKPEGMSVKYTDAYTLTPLTGSQYDRYDSADYVNYWIK